MKLPFFYSVILHDPVSAAIGLGASLLGASASLLAPKPKAPAAPLVPPTPPPVASPQGTPQSAGAPATQAPSFLAAAAAPAQANTIGGQGKTLLGQ